jgi:hypothetical protein
MVSATRIEALHRKSFHFKPLSQAKQGVAADCVDAGDRWGGGEHRRREGTTSEAEELARKQGPASHLRAAFSPAVADINGIAGKIKYVTRPVSFFALP